MYLIDHERAALQHDEDTRLPMQYAICATPLTFVTRHGWFGFSSRSFDSLDSFDLQLYISLVDPVWRPEPLRGL